MYCIPHNIDQPHRKLSHQLGLTFMYFFQLNMREHRLDQAVSRSVILCNIYVTRLINRYNE